MHFRVLGAVEMRSGNGPLDIGPPQQRLVLAALAAEAGQPVMTGALIDRVWTEAPDGARRTLQVHLTRIRRLLEQANDPDPQPARLVRRSGGYLLDVDPERVDVHRFRRLVGQAQDPRTSDSIRVVPLRECLDLWRGEPLAGLPGQWAVRVRETWRQEFLAAVAMWADAELGVDNPAAVVTRLTELTGEYPLEESLVAILMRALYAVGRTAEALQHYARARRLLAEDLGADPGPVLQQVHQAILRGNLDTVRPVTVPARRRKPPAQLPGDLFGFAGRKLELARLDRILSAADGPGNAVLICCLSGMAGVGKTTLALRWAHLVAHRFPDGQLYANLHGFDPAGAPVSPAEALRRFLDALEIPAQRIPADLDEQIALYRSELSGRRMLVVLDNVRDIEQVRPLLPGSPGSLVVVTSRNQLSGLVATDGAVPVALDLLTPSEAHDLLAARIGASRLAEEPDAAEEIVAACGRLPLALAIVAARAATHPSFPLAAIAAELRDAVGRLDALASGQTADVRAAFACSYDALSPAAARLFRLLAVHCGPDIGVSAAARLSSVPAGRVHPLLVELERAHLIMEDSPGRYTLHDLLRLYAAELLHRHEPDADQRDALHRVLDHYLHTAHAGALLLNPHRPALTGMAAVRSGAAVHELRDSGQALAWFVAERAVLVAAIRRAAADGFDVHAWRLAWTTADFLHRQGYWRDQIIVQDIALSAARRVLDTPAQANSLRYLGRTYARLGRLNEAQDHLLHALDLFRILDDPVGQGHIHRELCLVLEQQDRYADALDRAAQALTLFCSAGHQAGTASSLNAIGWYHALLGDYRKAITPCEQALRLFQSIGYRAMEGGTWDSLGYAYHHLGDYPMAVHCYRQALDLFRETGERYYEADTLIHLADSQVAADDHPSARKSLRIALDILAELDHHDIDRVRMKLKALDDASESSDHSSGPPPRCGNAETSPPPSARPPGPPRS